MLPVIALLQLVPLLSFALAAPSLSISTDALGLTEQHRAGLVLKTLHAIEKETQAGRTIDFDAVLSPAEREFLGFGRRDGKALQQRQLLGGGDEYAPYEMPCPDNYDWVRSAAVRTFTRSTTFTGTQYIGA